jgi:hypothetical protein
LGEFGGCLAILAEFGGFVSILGEIAHNIGNYTNKGIDGN